MARSKFLQQVPKWKSKKDVDSSPHRDFVRKFEAPFFGWQPNNDAMIGVDALEEELISILNERGPFDGIIGFSRGAWCACFLTYKLEFQNLKERLIHDPWKFIIALVNTRADLCGVAPYSCWKRQFRLAFSNKCDNPRQKSKFSMKLLMLWNAALMQMLK